MFKNLFTGRLNRMTYLVGYILWVMLFYVFLFSHQLFRDYLTYYWFIFTVLSYFVLISITVRRIQDVGLSPYTILLLIGTIIVAQFFPHERIFSLIVRLALILLVVWPGEKKKNQYGKAPKPHLELKKLFGN